MSGKAIIQYILFEYVTGWKPGTGYPIAVLSLISSEAGLRRVHLNISVGWREHVPEQAIPLLEDTFADWESLDMREAEDLFPHLAQAGSGPLQAAMSGTCSYSQLRAILKKALSIEPE